MPPKNARKEQELNEQSNSTEQIPDESQPKAKSRKRQKPDEHKPIEFQGDLYNFVPCQDRLCYACGTLIKGSFFHCEDKERYLHPFCCRLKPTIRDLKQSYTLVESSPIKCRRCKIKDNKRGLSYVCTTKKGLRFHVYCFMELIRDKNRDDVKVKGSKTEAFLEGLLSLTNNIVKDSLTGSDYSMFSLMIDPQ